MKRLLFMFTLLLAFFSFNISKLSADTISYAFESITIKSAFTFQVAITEEPNEQSYLYGHVTKGEKVTVYVGQLEFVNLGGGRVDESALVIVTNEAGEDIIRWVVNGHSRVGDETYEFSSHITINPTVGVEKTPDDGVAIQTEVIIKTRYTEDNERYNLYVLKDNTGTEYEMLPDTSMEETDLNIVIAAYQEEE